MRSKINRLRTRSLSLSSTPHDDVPQVGLPDDELYRRVKYHRGVYGKWEDTSPGDYTLFHMCPAQFFHRQLPIGTGMHGYIPEDFHHTGSVETFFDTAHLAAFANEQLADQAGYFYVLQLDPSHMPEVEEYTVEEEGKTGKVLVHGVIRVEAIQRIYVAARELDNSMSGKFTDVSPPTR